MSVVLFAVHIVPVDSKRTWFGYFAFSDSVLTVVQDDYELRSYAYEADIVDVACTRCHVIVALEGDVCIISHINFIENGVKIVPEKQSLRNVRIRQLSDSRIPTRFREHACIDPIVIASMRRAYYIQRDEDAGVTNLFKIFENDGFKCEEVKTKIPGMVVQCASGSDFFLFLTDRKVVYSMGTGLHGELGRGIIVDEAEPTEVNVPDEEVWKIAAGTWHAAALTKKGDLYVWGWNKYGQLGTDVRCFESLFYSYLKDFIEPYPYPVDPFELFNIEEDAITDVIADRFSTKIIIERDGGHQIFTLGSKPRMHESEMVEEDRE
ncbi:unnamed protein product [Caenorhabditis bovis]|uniref:Uncharacterized protein n=1 Tax=Caenorhabditis bovis TaxID=2654633 RepID=A0A8S1F8L0_9PELO|nr:unnamed protein product [Caenorhabditis bovis]